MPHYATGKTSDYLRDNLDEWHQSFSNSHISGDCFTRTKAELDLASETSNMCSPTPGMPYAAPVSRLTNTTLQRNDSERREKLCRAGDGQQERGTCSMASSAINPNAPTSRRSFPDLRSRIINGEMERKDSTNAKPQDNARYLNEASGRCSTPEDPQLSSSHIEGAADEINEEFETFSDVLNDSVLMAKIQSEWVLNLSMHFRDGTAREKFFVTYIEKPSLWRKVTISCDYRDASEDSLEFDLQSLHFQRDKNARIYVAIRESLPDIQFYDTVTNLKLQTSDGRLHVHVTEDVNEITEYPSIDLIRHLQFPSNGLLEVVESELLFEAHLSGFVYRVSNGGNTYVKKEISSPDTVEEFLYELNALAVLKDSIGVIRLVGVVLDDSFKYLKGLLIEWAPGGSLADYLFNCTERNVDWRQRLKWADQIISGIADIHESGFIQGDCTVSNIVLDADDNAKIVDINRRGCPVGWEPPEFEGMIRSGTPVSLFIGVKSDLYQLGMILWAIAKQTDEPEREEKPLRDEDIEAPLFYREIVRSCLAEQSSNRLPAKQLLERFRIAVGAEFDPSFELAQGHAPQYNRSPSPFSAADLEEMEMKKRLNTDHDFSHAPVHNDLSALYAAYTGSPDYKRQDGFLAGIGRFEEGNNSRENSETPMNTEAHTRRPLHQDSGFDMHILDDRYKEPVNLQTSSPQDEPVRQREHQRSVPFHQFSPTPPVHQDSGFVDSNLAYLESRTRRRAESPTPR